MLIVPFEVQISLGPGFMGMREVALWQLALVAAFEHGGVGGTRVEPDLQNVLAFGVGGRIVGTA